MDHLDDNRLMILAMDDREAPTETEASHLESCTRCAKILADENHVTASLSQMAPMPVPVNFAKMATARFVRERASEVRFTPFFIFSIALAVVLAAAMVWLVIDNPYEFVSKGAVLLGKVAGLIRAGYIVLNRVPLASEIVTTTSGAMVLICTGLLASLMKRSTAVK
ncbi:MAG: hypothetical protein GY847_29090 [Proteobacteria bacterium]|nr:hypothetical protein [Pseudomonadota bacterium]